METDPYAERPRRFATPEKPDPPKSNHCLECKCQTGGGNYCYEHKPYTVWPKANGTFLVDRNGRKRVSFDEPPLSLTEELRASVTELLDAAVERARKLMHDRFDVQQPGPATQHSWRFCPNCGKGGSNTEAVGGNARCWHCVACNYVDCSDRYPDDELPPHSETFPPRSLPVMDAVRFEVTISMRALSNLRGFVKHLWEESHDGGDFERTTWATQLDALLKQELG
jgi:hypothetical protein